MNKNKIKEGLKEKKKRKLIIFSIVVIIIIIGILLIIMPRSTDSHKIAVKISKLLDETTIVDDEADDNKYSYIESSFIYTNELEEIDSDRYAIVILKYNSKDEASIALKHINDEYTLFREKVDATILETLDILEEDLMGESGLIFVNGNFLIKIDCYYERKYDELKSKINKILEKYHTNNANSDTISLANNYWNQQLKDFSSSIDNLHNETIENFKEITEKVIKKLDNCKNNECENYLNQGLQYQKYAEVAEQVSLIQNKYEEIIQRKKDRATNISNSISKVEQSLNQNDYDKVKEIIEELEDKFYDTYEDEWNSRLEAIEEKVFKKSCTTLSYKEALRTPEKYKDRNTYWFGVIYQKVSSYQYRVGVNCSTNRFADSGYVCSDTIYVYYYGDENLIEDDVVKLWGTMNGTYTYQAVLGNTITIPAFYAKYVNVK